jgi:hypothetical protein
MKRVPLIIVGVTALAIASCCVGGGAMLWSGAKANKKLIKTFFDDVSAGKSEESYAQLHPLLKDKVDQPMFDVFCTAVKKRLGPLKTLSVTSFSSNRNTSGKFYEGTANGVFENGKGVLTIKAMGTEEGIKLTSFNIESDELKNWQAIPNDHTLYKQRCQAFLEAFAKGKGEEAWPLMHANLQKAVGKENFLKQVQKIAGMMGPNSTIEVKQSQSQKDHIVLSYFVKAKINFSAEFRVAFPEGFRGELLSYKINPK